MPTDPVTPRTPLDYSSVLADLRPAHWPPDEIDLQELALACAMLIFELDRWESVTQGRDVMDTAQGRITTAQARRILAREVAVADDAVAIMLVPAGDERVHVELRAVVAEDGHTLSRPELVLDWFQDGSEYEHHFRLEEKGPQWYLLAQLRDDLLENRLTMR